MGSNFIKMDVNEFQKIKEVLNKNFIQYIDENKKEYKNIVSYPKFSKENNDCVYSTLQPLKTHRKGINKIIFNKILFKLYLFLKNSLNPLFIFIENLNCKIKNLNFKTNKNYLDIKNLKEELENIKKQYSLFENKILDIENQFLDYSYFTNKKIENLMYKISLIDENIEKINIFKQNIRNFINIYKDQYSKDKQNILKLDDHLDNLQKDFNELKHNFNMLNKNIVDKYENIYKSISLLQTKYNQNLDYKKTYEKDYFINYGDADFYNTKNIATSLAKIINKKLKPKSVLDVGCGYGFIPQYFNKNNVKSEGIDISKFATEKLNLDYIIKADILDLNTIYKKNEFEIVICSEVLEHLPSENINQAINNLSFVSTKYIFLIITTSDIVLDNIDPYHISMYDKNFWEKKIKECNLNIDQNLTRYFNNHIYFKKMKWEGRCWIIKKL